MKFDVMGDTERPFEIDVRPVLGQTEYQKLLEVSGGKPAHKVFIKPRTEKKNKTENGDVLEKIQYWYPEGEF